MRTTYNLPIQNGRGTRSYVSFHVSEYPVYIRSIDIPLFIFKIFALEIGDFHGAPHSTTMRICPMSLLVSIDF